MARLTSLLLVFFVLAALFIDITLASSWLFGSDKVYNAWHKTELEKWLDDHDIPYPAAADRKDLADAVAKNWDKATAAAYETWDDNRLRTWLEKRAIEFDANAKKDYLIDQVKSNWYGATAEAESSWESVKDWIFDSWSESHLKAFLDKHGIPCPQPRTRDTLLAKARSSWEDIRQSAKDTAAAPGNWLYDSWSDSDLKSWCDYRGIPVPQGSKRNELVALVRKNMRKAKFQGKDAYLVASATVSSAASVAYDSASSLASSAGSVGYDSASSLLTKATDSASSAGAKYGAQATEYASRKRDQAFEAAIDAWSDTRLKAYLDERGVPVPQNGKIDELRALVRHNAHKAKVRAGFSDDAFDTWSSEQLQEYLGKKAKGTRDELISSAKKQYASASAKGGKEWEALTAKGAKATAYLFDQWSDSDLKSFLDSYGVPVPQGSKRNELIAAARRNSRYFTQGPDWYSTGLIAQIQSYYNQGVGYIKDFIAGASGAAYNAGEKAGDAVKEQATIAKDRVQEATQKAGNRAYEKGQQGYDKVKEEL